MPAKQTVEDVRGAAATRELPALLGGMRAAEVNWTPRIAAAAALALLVLAAPLYLSDVRVFQITLAFIYGIAAVSMNQLIGYAGQISLGHQAFIGVGAFASANAVVEMGLPFWFAVPVGGLTGALAGFVLGLPALRLKGLYFALLTLAYGFMAEGTIFLVRAFTKGAAGLSAPRPGGFTSDATYYLIVVGFFAVLQFLDWRFIKTKAGRAVLAIRDDERVAAVNGINVAAYKLLIFSLSGFYAGIAGALFAHWRTQVVAVDFTFTLALTFVLIVILGGVNSRAGIFIAATIFSLLALILGEIAPGLATWVQAIGAGLLVVTLIFYPGGIGEQIRPFTDWFAGKPLSFKHGHPDTGPGR